MIVNATGRGRGDPRLHERFAERTVGVLRGCEGDATVGVEVRYAEAHLVCSRRWIGVGAGRRLLREWSIWRADIKRRHAIGILVHVHLVTRSGSHSINDDATCGAGHNNDRGHDYIGGNSHGGHDASVRVR